MSQTSTAAKAHQDIATARVGETDSQQSERDRVARDSLRILPLSMIPLQTTALKRARLIKNVYLESAVEFFRDAATGSGQVAPENLPEHLGWDPDRPPPDMDTIRALARINSYDVYSLRIELRRLGIKVNDHSQLTLSDKKSQELAKYMKTFTGPLISQVFGSTNPDVDDFDQLVSMFKSPNKAEALKNLKILAEKLQIELLDVPRFLEDYGDTFLSLAYFKECMDDVVPKVMDFLENIVDLRGNYQLKNTPGFISACNEIEPRLNSIITSITGRFESFDQHTKYLWSNISAESFQRVRRLITEHHATIGGVLCGLSVKMDAWDEKFGRIERGTVVIRRADFVMGEMRRGLEKIETIERSAPQLSQVH
ncbi:MAG: hypothetical protein ACFCUQ_20730 [Kiloniellales bacterium]